MNCSIMMPISGSQNLIINYLELILSKQKHLRFQMFAFHFGRNGRPRPPAFDRIKTFDHHDLTAKHCYFVCTRSPDVDRIKIFDKDDQAAKHCSCIE